MEAIIYLDNASTTPIDPCVLEFMFSILREEYGNPASVTHLLGRQARDRVEEARIQTAHALGASPREIVFTSSATESANLAIKGAAAAYSNRGRHIICSLAEHKAVLESCRHLERAGWEITWLQPDPHGRIAPEQTASAIRKETFLVCAMAANNILGTLNPIEAIGRICKQRGVLFFCDATQAVGKIPLDVHRMGIDLLAISAHKFHGPKGVGALYVRERAPRVRLEPLFSGGGQERGLRSGTVNAPGVAGCGFACELAMQELSHETARLTELRNGLEAALVEKITGTRIHGQACARAPHISCMSFPGVPAKALLESMPGIAASAGSACGSIHPEPNHVLHAIGMNEEEARTAIRISLGRFTTEEHIRQAVDSIAAAASGYV